jgi:hypothetical protein
MRLVGKPYTDIREMIRDTCGEEVLKEVLEYQEARRLTTSLVLRRVALDVTPDEMAANLGWKPGKLDAFEGSTDDSHTAADLRKYATAVGLNLNVETTPVYDPNNQTVEL